MMMDVVLEDEGRDAVADRMFDFKDLVRAKANLDIQRMRRRRKNPDSVVGNVEERTINALQKARTQRLSKSVDTPDTLHNGIEGYSMLDCAEKIADVEGKERVDVEGKGEIDVEEKEKTANVEGKYKATDTAGTSETADAEAKDNAAEYGGKGKVAESDGNGNNTEDGQK
jgi:hypothetical protein